MLRILAGEKRGMHLRVANTTAVRPTASNARQVLFDILGPRVIGTRWLDLFAGSGAVGLEALSRGAADCVLVEASHRCIKTIRQNIAALDYVDRCRVLPVAAEKAINLLAAAAKPFDMIFLDPPYSGDEAKRTLLALGNPSASAVLLTKDGLVIAQLSTHSEILDAYGSLALQRERKLGDTRLCFFRAREDYDGDAPTAKSSLPGDPFVGRWKDRTDMRDSVKWVRRLRRTKWRR